MHALCAYAQNAEALQQLAFVAVRIIRFAENAMTLTTQMRFYRQSEFNKRTTIMIIDAHVHIYPEKIADKAVEGIKSFYNMHLEYDGRISTLLREGKKAGVDKFIVQSVATSWEQVKSINDFIAKSAAENPEFIGFGTMHPDFPDIAGEVERITALGLKGIKLHSDFQRFNIDDERAFPIYEAAEGRLPILMHMGDARSDFSAPERLVKVIERFPKLTVIGRISRVGAYGIEPKRYLREREFTPTVQVRCTHFRLSALLNLFINSARTRFYGEQTILCGITLMNLQDLTNFRLVKKSVR